MLFRPVTLDEVRNAYMASATDISPADGLTRERERIMQKLHRARICYDGGPKAVELLMKRDTENGLEWRARRNHYRNVPIMRRAVRKQAWLVFGNGPDLDVWVGDKPPSFRAKYLAKQQGAEIKADDTTQRVGEWVRDTFEANHFDSLQYKAMCGRLRYGCAPLKIWPVNMSGQEAPDFTNLRMDLFDTWDALPIYDPDDPDVLLGVVEARVRGKDVRWRLWTSDEIVWVDDSMKPVADAGMHPLPGIVPWAFLGDGQSTVDDLIEYQKVLINMHSVRWAVERSTAFPVGVAAGKMLNREQRVDGVQGLDVGGGLRYLAFEDPSGGFSLVSANAPFAELLESYQAELKEALWLGGGLPTDSQMEGINAEQPTTIALRWLDSFVDRDERVLEATDWLDTIMHVVAGYGAEYNASFDLPAFQEGDVDWNWNFPQNPLPHDAANQQEAERMEVMADLRLSADYVKRNVIPEADPDELDLYMGQLEKQGTSSNPFGELPPPPPEEPNAEQA